MQPGMDHAKGPPPLGDGGGRGGTPPSGPPRPPRDGDPYRINFSKEWATGQRESLFAAAQEFFRAWHSERGNMRLKGRRPREVEVRVLLKTGDVLRLYFAGDKTIDQLLSGKHSLLERQLRRAGLDPSMLRAERHGGDMTSVQLAVSGLYPASGSEIDAGARIRVRTGVRGRIAEVRGRIREERAAPPDDQDLAKLVVLEAELDALQKLPQTNREAMERFKRESVYAAEQRLAELGPRGAFEAAVKLASQTGTRVELRVKGDRIPIVPQVSKGDSAQVQTVYRKKQAADVDVLRSKNTGRFVSAMPGAARLRILARAEQQGFSKVARELGIKRTTIYEWRKLRE